MYITNCHFRPELKAISNIYHDFGFLLRESDISIQLDEMISEHNLLYAVLISNVSAQAQIYKRPSLKEARDDFNDKTKEILIDNLDSFLQTWEVKKAMIERRLVQSSIKKLKLIGITYEQLRDLSFWTKAFGAHEDVLGSPEGHDEDFRMYFTGMEKINADLLQLYSTMDDLGKYLEEIKNKISEKENLVGIGRGSLEKFSRDLCFILKSGTEKLQEQQTHSKAVMFEDYRNNPRQSAESVRQLVKQLTIWTTD